nr:MAG TPA: hypothetical protein [Caudoviricetes sp.]
MLPKTTARPAQKWHSKNCTQNLQLLDLSSKVCFVLMKMEMLHQTKTNQPA